MLKQCCVSLLIAGLTVGALSREATAQRPVPITEYISMNIGGVNYSLPKFHIDWPIDWLENSYIRYGSCGQISTVPNAKVYFHYFNSDNTQPVTVTVTVEIVPMDYTGRVYGRKSFVNTLNPNAIKPDPWFEVPLNVTKEEIINSPTNKWQAIITVKNSRTSEQVILQTEPLKVENIASSKHNQREVSYSANTIPQVKGCEMLIPEDDDLQIKPTQVKQVTPAQLKPVVPIRVKPVRPTQPNPVTPVQLKPVTTTQPKPVAPVLKITRPVRPSQI